MWKDELYVFRKHLCFSTTPENLHQNLENALNRRVHRQTAGVSTIPSVTEEPLSATDKCVT